MAQAGVTQPEKMDEALGKVIEMIKAFDANQKFILEGGLFEL